MRAAPLPRTCANSENSVWFRQSDCLVICQCWRENQAVFKNFCNFWNWRSNNHNHFRHWLVRLCFRKSFGFSRCQTTNRILLVCLKHTEALREPQSVVTNGFHLYYQGNVYIYCPTHFLLRPQTAGTQVKAHSMPVSQKTEESESQEGMKMCPDSDQQSWRNQRTSNWGPALRR